MIKIGILGAARIAPPAIIEPAARREDVVVHAVASRRPGVAAEYADSHGIEFAYEGYAALIADPEIDLVYNALPPVDHARWSISALEAGKHVLCEKPFAMNLREAEVMADAASRTGKRLFEAFHDRLHPVFEYLLKLKNDGTLGEIRRLDGVFNAHIPYRPNELRHIPEQGGGALMDLGCYPAHWMRQFMGSEPEVISASGERSEAGVDLTMQAELMFAGDVPAHLGTDMREGTPFHALLSVECANGRIEIENPIHPHRGHSVREWLNGGYRIHTVAGETTYDHQLDSVVKAISQDIPYPCDARDAVGNMALIDAIYEKAGFGPR